MSHATCLIDVLAQPGFARAAVTLAAVGTSTGLLGCVLLARRLALLADVLAHSMLPGVGIAWLISGVSVPALLVGALGAGLATALGSGLISRFTVLAEDAASAALFTTMFATGLLLAEATGGSEELLHLLAGDVLGIGRGDAVLAVAMAGLTLAFFALCERGIIMECFDPEFHRASGGYGKAIHLGLLALVVVALVVALRAVGAILAVGLFMLPAASAALWSRSWRGRLTVAALLGGLGPLLGLVLACRLGVAPGACIVTTLGAVFLISLPVGALYRAIRRSRAQALAGTR
jgi:zinc/manganese transport system permease protein